MAVFDVAQRVVAQSAGLIQGSTDVSPDMLADLEAALEGMDLGPLLGLWLQSFVVQLTMTALNIVIFVIVYGRMIARENSGTTANGWARPGPPPTRSSCGGS